MTILHASAESETRTLTRVGAIAVLALVITTTFLLLAKPFDSRPRNVISVVIEAAYVGHGVIADTPVIMHGVKIGRVVSVANNAGGGVRLQTDLQRDPTRGLTDAMGIDYRPSNYFGVTAINIIPVQGGRPLKSGMQIKVKPEGNFSLQALLYRLGELSNGVFNQRLISVIERSTRYVDGLNPLLETALIVGNSIAKVQTVSSEQLLRNATGISVAFPGFLSAIIGTGKDIYHTGYAGFNLEAVKKRNRYYPTWDENRKRHLEEMYRMFTENLSNDKWFEYSHDQILNIAKTDLFLRVGYLEGSHINELFPVLESVRTLADTVPKILSPDSFAYTITEMRRRLERMYEGSGEQRALQVRLILDRVPGVAAPLGLATGSHQ
ncbi:Mammalian cell entry related domain protein [Mycobacterium vicinigordonae]|uniref:Mammalian cell entry related domain protein n=1 Tax=Mycobacterium vicinigordonae TaxID=1719132 RepID=A0A7D6HSW7_9MYCO|nr:Mammalian cell entry related domain protein [Mycobacterium vicinigordonae]QLL09131.1 Mammalian cell entry related domain protein [Mycobacterium vicinigordonae]